MEGEKNEKQYRTVFQDNNYNRNFFIGYHKYILSLFDKKLDKRDCEKERLYAEKFRIENIKTLTDGIKRIEERMTRIEKQLMKQYKN